ncbi:MAG: hypothetical protein RL653_4521 [Pseudomonadota bacterium]|jgi:isopenicillin N synthase-like dioxygenase
MSIPSVDLSHYTHGTSQQKADFVRTFGAGIQEFGFVTVSNHGVDGDLIQRTYSDVAKLFALPEAVKQGYEVPGGGGQRGYTGYGKEHAKNQKVGDLKEFWHVGRELPANHPRLAAYGNNVWPKELESFRRHSLELYTALDRAAEVFLDALSEFYGLGQGRLSEMAKDGNSVLRLIHYPPLRDKFIPGGVRAAEHEDINLITLLCESTSSGLEILTREGEWLPVQALRGTIVVDSGDMLSRVSNEKIPATTHRVVNPKTPAEDVTRYSMPFFVHPYPECDLTPLPEMGEAKFPPITADGFLQQRLREIGLVK